MCRLILRCDLCANKLIGMPLNLGRKPLCYCTGCIQVGCVDGTEPCIMRPSADQITVHGWGIWPVPCHRVHTNRPNVKPNCQVAADPQTKTIWLGFILWSDLWSRKYSSLSLDSCHLSSFTICECSNLFVIHCVSCCSLSDFCRLMPQLWQVFMLQSCFRRPACSCLNVQRMVSTLVVVVVVFVIYRVFQKK